MVALKHLAFLLYSSIVLGAALPDEQEEPADPEAEIHNSTITWGNDYTHIDCAHGGSPYVVEEGFKLHVVFDPRIHSEDEEGGRWVVINLEDGPQDQAYSLKCADEDDEEDGPVDKWQTVQVPSENGADHLNIQIHPGNYCDAEDKDWTDDDIFDNLWIKVGNHKMNVPEDCPMEMCVAKREFIQPSYIHEHRGAIAHCYF